LQRTHQPVQRTHQPVQRQRRDFHHKTARSLLSANDTLYVEEVRVATLVRTRHRATSISAVGWASFRTIRDATAACAGRHVVAVPPASTSQDCSGCGARVPKSVSVRTHSCTSCGLVLARDENAARTIHWAGQALRGLVAVATGTNRASVGL
jgi:putative transposase